MDPMTVMAIGQAAGGAIQGVQGIIQTSEAKKIARNNPRPKYKIQKEVFDNQAIAESRGSTGLSDAALQVLRQGNERGLTTSIEAILDAGGSANNIGDLYGNYQDGVSKMALIDEEMRRRNIDNLVAQNMRLSNEKDKEWQVNVFADYANKAQAAAALKAQGSQNIWKGVNTVLGAGANFATGQQYKNQANNVYPSGNLASLSDSNGAAAPINANSAPFNLNNPLSDFMWTMPNTQNPPIPTAADNVRTTFPGLIPGSIFDNGTIYKKI